MAEDRSGVDEAGAADAAAVADATGEVDLALSFRDEEVLSRLMTDGGLAAWRFWNKRATRKRVPPSSCRCEHVAVRDGWQARRAYFFKAVALIRSTRFLAPETLSLVGSMIVKKFPALL